jgi:predicted transcriptional regulator
MTKTQALQLANKILSMPENARKEAISYIDLLYGTPGYTEEIDTEEDFAAIEEALQQVANGEVLTHSSMMETINRYRKNATTTF